MTTTTNRGYSTPATGTEVDIWGSDDLNPNFEAIDSNLGGIATVSVSSGTTTLNSTQYANGTIVLTGGLTGTVVVVFPSVQGWWTVDNQTNNNAAIFLTSGGGNLTGVPPGEQIDIQVNGTNPIKYRNLGRVGSFLDMAVASVPSWIANSTIPPYLLCNGASFSSVTYPALAAVLGTTTLPDLRGRSRFYLNGGTGRITAAGSGINGDAIFSAGGFQTATISQANIPNYFLPITDPTHAHTGVRGAFTVFVSSGGNLNIPQTGGVFASDTSTAPAGTGISVNSGGSGTPMSIMNPAFISGISLIRAA